MPPRSMEGLLGAVQSSSGALQGSFMGMIESWDIRSSDLMNLARGKIHAFRHRRERRLFDRIDAGKTGFVTLNEIISFREKTEEDDPELANTPLLSMQPDLTRSLVALYHFDVRLDGHLNFDEFVLLQAYLQKVERTIEDDEVVCCCIPKMWFKRSPAKKKKKAVRNGRHLHVEFEDRAVSSANDHSTPQRKNRTERVVSRKKKQNGQLENVAMDPDWGPMSPIPSSEHDSFANDAGAPFAEHVSSPVHGGSMDPESGGSHEGEEEDEGDEEDEEDEDSQGMKNQLEELRRQRRSMLVQTLKNNKGRKRFMEWLYRLADTTRSDSITEEELIVFLKAIAADGINPEAFVDPSEDCDDSLDGSRTPNRSAMDSLSSSTHVDTGGVAAGGGDRMSNSAAYLKDLARRIMSRYDDSRTGTLLRDEFMQLAAMVEREYELYHLDDKENNVCENVGPYRLIRKLGKGAEGVVKLGISQETGVKKAVKIIKKGNIASMSRVDREIEAMVVLDHPCVVSVDEVLETDASIFLVMEYCAGGHLEDYISPKRPMSTAAARFYFYQLIDGVVYCHSKGVCHRDLRVENLMLDNKGNLKITDFGHAGIFEQGWDVFQTMLVGSVSHLAPEQVEGTVYSGEKIDVWSVGIILYIMVTGVSPFQADSAEELLDLIRGGKYREPEGIDQDCRHVIASTLQIEQAQRPSSLALQASEFLKGAQEKLVLQHCEFMMEARVQDPEDWISQFKKALREQDVNVSDKDKSKKQTCHEKEGDKDDEIDSTVRTVEAEEDELSTHLSSMKLRAVSFHVLRCVHESHHLVFKVTITMMSPDAGQQNPYPVVSFDLQSGEAAFFQRVFRKIRARYMNQVSYNAKMCMTRQVSDKRLGLSHITNDDFGRSQSSSASIFSQSQSFAEDSPFIDFAAAMGLRQSSSYVNALKGTPSAPGSQ